MINILNDSEIIVDWPHEAIFSNSNTPRHPNSQVLVKRGKEECVAVYGESFTYGDNMETPFVEQQIRLKKLTTIDKKSNLNEFINRNKKFQIRRDNFTYRMNNNFGGYLTRMMDTDYYHSCVPGQGTTTTLYGLENSIERLSTSYDKVYIIFQLTDPARDFDITGSNANLYRLSKEQHQQNIDELFNKNLELDEFFLHYEQIFADRLKELKKEYPNCEFIVWRNFTRWCGANFTDVIKIDDVMIEYYNTLLKNKKLNMPIMGYFWDGLEEHFIDDFPWYNPSETTVPIEYKMREIDWRKETWDFMESNENFYEDVYHPSPIGHKVWAENILQYIEKYND